MLGNQIILTNNVAKQVISVTATQDQTDFTVEGGYRINQLGVYRNGVRQVDGRDYIARNGATVTLLSQGANAGDAMEFVVFDDFRVADALSVNTGGTVNASVNITGALQMGTGTSIFSPADNTLTFGTNSNERVRITSDGLVGIGTDVVDSQKLSIGGTDGYLQKHGIGVYNPHSLGLRNGVLVHSNKGYNNTFSYRAAAFMAVGNSGHALGISTDANTNGLGGTLNGYIKFDGSAYFGGDVGIGTNSPAGETDVSSTGTTRFFIEGNDGRNEIRSNNGTLSFFTNQDANASGANKTIFYRNGANESMRIDENGKVGIGTDNVDYKLEVFGTPGADGDFSIKSSASASGGTEHSKLRFRVRNGSNQESTKASIHVESAENWGGNLIFGTKTASGGLSESTVERLRITPSGDVGIGTDIPPARVSGVIESNVTKYLPADYSENWAGAFINEEDGATYNGVLIANRWRGTESTVLKVGSLFNSHAEFDSYFVIDGVGKIGIGTDVPESNVHILSGNDSGNNANAPTKLLVFTWVREELMTIIFKLMQ